MVKSKVLGFIACTARSWHSISVRPSRFSIVSKRTHIHSDFFQHQVGPSLWFFVPNRRYKILTTRPSTGALNTWSRKKRVFRTKSLFTSESVDIRDRSVVTMDHYQKAEHQRHQILGTPTYANIYEQPNFACWPQTRDNFLRGPRACSPTLGWEGKFVIILRMLIMFDLGRCWRANNRRAIYCRHTVTIFVSVRHVVISYLNDCTYYQTFWRIW